MLQAAPGRPRHLHVDGARGTGGLAAGAAVRPAPQPARPVRGQPPARRARDRAAGAGPAACACSPAPCTTRPSRSSTGCRTATAFVDAAGGPVHVPPADGRALTYLDRDGDPHRRARPRPRARGRAGAGRRRSRPAPAWPSENERLHAEIRAQLREVQASRARIVEAADAARRRVERDLHDGAQQRLVTVALALARRSRLRSRRRRGGRRPAEGDRRGARRRAGRAAGAGPRHLPGAAHRRRARAGAVAPGRALAGPGGRRRRAGRAPARSRSSRRPTSSSPRRWPTRPSTPAARVTIDRADRRRLDLIVEVADDGVGGADPRRLGAARAGGPGRRRRWPAAPLEPAGGGHPGDGRAAVPLNRSWRPADGQMLDTPPALPDVVGMQPTALSRPALRVVVADDAVLFRRGPVAGADRGRLRGDRAGRRRAGAARPGARAIRRTSSSSTSGCPRRTPPRVSTPPGAPREPSGRRRARAVRARRGALRAPADRGRRDREPATCSRSASPTSPS